MKAKVKAGWICTLKSFIYLITKCYRKIFLKKEAIILFLIKNAESDWKTGALHVFSVFAMFVYKVGFAGFLHAQ